MDFIEEATQDLGANRFRGPRLIAAPARRQTGQDVHEYTPVAPPRI